MTAILIGISIAITLVACLIRFAVWVFFPRRIEFEQNEMLPNDWEKTQ